MSTLRARLQPTQFFEAFERNRTLQLLLLAAIVAAAASLRFYRLGEWSYWIDEIYTVEGGIYVADWPVSRLPLSLLLTNLVMNGLGFSEWSARLAPAVIGIATLPALFFPLRRLLGGTVALTAVMLLAVSPWHLFWSQNARFYALLFLFYNLGMLWLLLGLVEKRRLFVILGVLLLIVTAREKATGLIFIPAVAAYFLISLWLFNEEHHRPKPVFLALALAPLVLFFLFELISFFFSGYTQIRGIIDTFAGQSNHSPVRLLASIVWRIGLGPFIFALGSGLYFTLQRQRAGVFFFMSALGPILTLVLVAPFVFTVDRYAFVSLLAWLVLCAMGIRILLERNDYREWLLAAGVLLMLLLPMAAENAFYFTDQYGQRPRWREAFALVAADDRPGDAVYTTYPEIGATYGRPESVYINDLTIADLEAAGERSWFIIDRATGFVRPELESWIQARARLVERLVVRLPGKAMDIEIYLYDPAQAGRAGPGGRG